MGGVLCHFLDLNVLEVLVSQCILLIIVSRKIISLLVLKEGCHGVI